MLELWRPSHLAADADIAGAIAREEARQRDGIELIASENYASAAVLNAVGSVLTNKYAEGYPGKRYYGGCEYVDVAEQIAIDRAKTLFGVEHANVQPHSGANANLAAYLSLIEPGDRILGLSLQEGGHLTHGLKVNFSGRLFEPHFYGVDRETGLLDYDAIAATAPPPAGLIAAGLHPTPIGHAHVTMTTTHKTLRGPRGGMILCAAEHAKAIDKSIFPGIQGGPLMHVIAAKAVAFKEALEPSFTDYCRQIIANAKALADEL